MPETKPTSTGGFNLSDPSTMNMLAWLLGGGAQAVMGEHQQTWQAGFGKVAQESARAQQYGELLKKLLAGGGSLGADGKGLTLKVPTETEAGAGQVSSGTVQQSRGQSQSGMGLLHLLMSGMYD